jgi:hypothetical protein
MYGTFDGDVIAFDIFDDIADVQVEWNTPDLRFF